MSSEDWNSVVNVELGELQCRWVGCNCVFFFQAEDGIRDAQESRGLGDVYKRQVLSYPRPSDSYKLQNKMRDRLGIHMTPFTMEALQEARKRLQEGGTVLTGLDRPWEESSYRPKFFGRSAVLPVAYVQLAMRVGVPVVVVATYQTPDGFYCLDCTEPVTMVTSNDREKDILHNAELLLSLAEKFIRQYKDQWAMFYPVWPDALSEIKPLKG